MSNPLCFCVNCDRTIDTSSINSSDSPVTSHSTLDVGNTQFNSSRSPAQHVQLVTEFYRTCTDYIFSIKIEVRILDSRLSLFIIISLYIHTLSWCQKVVGFSRNWENLTAIELDNVRSLYVVRNNVEHLCNSNLLLYYINLIMYK